MIIKLDIEEIHNKYNSNNNIIIHDLQIGYL